MMRGSLILIAGVLALPGCATKRVALQSLETRMSALDSVALCATISTLEFEDARAQTSERALRVPTFSWGGQRDEVRPPLSDELRDVIRSELSRRVTGDGPPYWIRVRVVEGVQRFQARTLSEEESVTWSTEVMLQRQDGDETGMTVGRSELEYAVSSRDASRSFADTLSRRVLRFAVADAFTRAAQGVRLGKNGASCTRRSPSSPVTLFRPARAGNNPEADVSEPL